MPDRPYRILVTGSRDWDDEERVAYELGLAVGDALRQGYAHTSIVIVHGACPSGADRAADRIARDYGHRVERHPADWDRYGRAAGPKRNTEMVALGANTCLAFIRNGSRGASHCAGLAERAGVPVKRVEMRDDGLGGGVLRDQPALQQDALAKVRQILDGSLTDPGTPLLRRPVALG